MRENCGREEAGQAGGSGKGGEEIRETFCPEETFALGKWLGEQAGPGEIFCLDGDLGTGKTVFTQGFAAGLGIAEPVNSPTFTIVQLYGGGRLPLYHFDVYRIGDPSEMDEIGYEDCFFGEGVCLVEWASLIEELIPEEAVWIRLEKDAGRGFDYRRITLAAAGQGRLGRHRQKADGFGGERNL